MHISAMTHVEAQDIFCTVPVLSKGSHNMKLSSLSIFRKLLNSRTLLHTTTAPVLNSPYPAT